MYQERAAAAALAAVVEALWQRSPAQRSPTTGADAPHRILPDGCMDLIWIDGSLLVAGPDTRAQLATPRPEATYAAVRFAPGAGPTFFGVPGHALCNGRIPLADLWPAAKVSGLADRISGAADRPTALAAEVAARLADTGPPDPLAAFVAARQRAGAEVADLARHAGLSTRQLHRRCLDAFGYGPKLLGRVLRFRRALAQARAGVPFATVAAAVGYADQAHLAREVRALAGVPLRVLLS